MEARELFSVAHKTVLVTGGGRGIGEMIARGFIENNATVYIVSRDGKVCKQVAEELTAKGPGKCIALPSLDFTQSESPKKLLEYLQEAGVTKLNVLVNNSGVTWGEPLLKYSEKGWNKVMDVNVKAIFFIIQALLPLLQQSASQSDPVRIINVGSIAGIRAGPFPTYAYDVSKAAVHFLTSKLASELSSQFITVNAIAPGFVPSKMSKQLLTYAPEELFAESVPLKRIGTAEDMAGIALYFSSRAGAWVTGVVVPVDGGALVSFSANI